jgi:hypothetical protein
MYERQQLPQAPQLPPQISEMLTSCFGQMPQIPECGTMRDLPMEDRPPTGRERRGPAPAMRQAIALRNIEIEVRNRAAVAINRECSSLITGDDETLWSSDLRLDESSTSNYSTRDSESYTDDDTDTQGDTTRTDTTRTDTITVNENNKPQAEASNSDDGIPVLVTSVRDRFHYMSAHKKFSNPVSDDPPSDKSVTTMKSMQADEAKNMLGTRPKLATLRLSAFPSTHLTGNQPPTPASGSNNSTSTQDKLKRQNALAKQIMRRRANAASNRVALEP